MLYLGLVCCLSTVHSVVLDALHLFSHLLSTGSHVLFILFLEFCCLIIFTTTIAHIVTFSYLPWQRLRRLRALMIKLSGVDRCIITKLEEPNLIPIHRQQWQFYPRLVSMLLILIIFSFLQITLFPLTLIFYPMFLLILPTIALHILMRIK